MAVDNWTREQTIVALNLYCKIPFNRVSSNHPDIIRIAKIIGRTPNSVKMKIGNFGSFDPELKKRGIVGLGNTSKLDNAVWIEFNRDWDNLAYESELLISKFTHQPIEKVAEINTAIYENQAVISYQNVINGIGIGIGKELKRIELKGKSQKGENITCNYCAGMSEQDKKADNHKCYN